MIVSSFKFLYDFAKSCLEWCTTLIYPPAITQEGIDNACPVYPPAIIQEEIDSACAVHPGLASIDPKERYIELWKQLTSPPLSQTEFPLKHYKLSVDHNGLLQLDTEYGESLNYTETEALQIAGAIYQMALAIDESDAIRKANFLFKGVGYYLMRPFAVHFPYPSVRIVNNTFRQYAYHLRRQSRYAKTDDENSIVILRFFRKIRYKQNKPNRIDPDDIAISDSLRSSRIEETIRNPKAPALLPEVTREAKLAWVEVHKPQLGSLATSVIQAITYRSHAKFMQRLEHAVEKFNAHINSLPSDKQHYVIVLPRETAIKSNHWVTGLALQFLRKKPMGILVADELSDFQSMHPLLDSLVCFDDAAYSGRQMAEHIRRLSRHVDLEINLIIPFYTNTSLWRIPPGVNFFRSERMLSPGELHAARVWTDDETKQFDQALERRGQSFGAFHSEASERYGTFFQHKIADDTSTFLNCELDEFGVDTRSVLLPKGGDYRTPY